MLKDISIENIKKSYLKIDFLVEKYLYEPSEAKEYINSVYFLENMSNIDLARWYVLNFWSYTDYLNLGTDYELYEYINHEALKKEAELYKNINVKNFVSMSVANFVPVRQFNYVALEDDILKEDKFLDVFYRYKNNIFGITETKITWTGDNYLDIYTAEHAYYAMKRLIDNGSDIDNAAEITCKEFLAEELRYEK